MFLKHPVAPVVDVLQQFMFFTQVMFWNSGRQGAAGYMLPLHDQLATGRMPNVRSQFFQGVETTDWWTLIQ
jgi:hypothetical protein